MKCKINLRGRSLYIDGIPIGMYGIFTGKLCFDSSMVIEGVIKDIEYQVDWNLEEIKKLLEQEFNEKEWEVFKFRRGLLKF